MKIAITNRSTNPNSICNAKLPTFKIDNISLQDEEAKATEAHRPANCFIPTMHLTDHPALASSLLNTYQVGDVIDEAVCFEKDAVPIFSLKPTIKQV